MHERLARRGLTLPAALAAAAVPCGAVPVALADATVRAAAAGKVVGLSARAVALADSLMQTTFLTRLTAVLLLAVVGGALIVGLGMAARWAKDGQESSGAPRAAPAADVDPRGHALPILASADLLGDPLPPGALARLGTVRFRTGAQVYRLAYSSDGTLLFSCAGGREILNEDDKNVLLWEARSGRLLRRFEGHEHLVMCLAVSPDGKTLASGSADGTYRLWDVATAKERHRFPGGSDFPRVAAFSPDGTTLATGDGGAVVLREAATGKELRRLVGHKDVILGVAFSPDSKRLAATDYAPTVRLWELAAGKVEQQVKGSGCAFTPDGKGLLVDEGSVVSLRDLDTGKERFRHAGSFVDLAPDGKSLAIRDASGWGALFVDLTTGKEVSRLRGREVAVSAAAFSPNGKTLATGTDRRIQLWETATGKEVRLTESHNHVVTALCYTPDGQELATGAADGVIRFWEAGTGKLRRQIEQPSTGLVVLALTPDGTTLASATGYDGIIRLWDRATGKERRVLKGPPDGVRYLTFSPDGRLLAAGEQNAHIRLWDMASGQEVRSLRGYSWRVSFSADGRYLAAQEDQRVAVLETATGKLVHALHVAEESPFSLAFSPAGPALAVSYYSGNIRLWHAETGKELRRIESQQALIHSLAFSPDGRTLAAAGADALHLWEVATGRQRRTFTGHLSWTDSLAFSPDGRTVATGSADTTALVWDVTGTGQPGPLATRDVSAEELEAWWGDLAGEDAAKAHRAVWSLAAGRQTVAFVQKHLPPVPADLDRRAAQLLADLDSDRFAVREQASRELERLGEAVSPTLRRALEGEPSLEVRRRIEQLLRPPEEQKDAAERLRVERALEVLEWAGTPEAERLLEALARGAPEARLTLEAKASLGRLAQRPVAAP